MDRLFCYEMYTKARTDGKMGAPFSQEMERNKNKKSLLFLLLFVILSKG